MSKKLVNFKLSPVAIAQLEELSENSTKVSVIERGIDLAYQNYKQNKNSSKANKKGIALPIEVLESE